MGLGVALPGTSQAAGGGQGGGGDEATDLVFVNGRIHTMDERNPLVSAVAIRDGKFISVGNAAHSGGNFVEAPHSGDVVKVVRLSARGDYLGAVRISG